jgi:two-component system, sensor histidine kinase PdtaS
MAIRATGVVMLAIMVLLAIVLATTQFTSSRAQARIEAHRAAHVVATHFYWVLHASEQALRRVEDAVGQTSGDHDTIRDIDEAVRDLPEGYQYSVYDDTGRLRYSSVPGASAVTVADREYFTRLRDGKKTVITPQITERLTGQEVFVLARRLERDGQFAGAATIAIPQAALVELANVLGLIDGSTISLVANDGMLISREPSIPPMNLAGTRLFDELAKASDGTYLNVSPADGTRRIIGYWQITDWPLVAIVGISNASAYASFWQHWSLASILLIPVALFTGWLLHRLTTMLRQDELRQAELVTAIDRGNFLLREIHHRVKNNLQTVMSLIRLEKLPPDVKQSLSLRIEAMVKVHEEMYHSDQFERVQLRPYLTRLIQGIARSHALNVDLEIDIAPVDLSGDRAMQLGLLTNELVSNAYKHAFQNRGTGRLSVRLTQPADNLLRLELTDDGPGFVHAETEDRMGTRLVAAFASQLGGKVTVPYGRWRAYPCGVSPRIYRLTLALPRLSTVSAPVSSQSRNSVRSCVVRQSVS